MLNYQQLIFSQTIKDSGSNRNNKSVWKENWKEVSGQQWNQDLKHLPIPNAVLYVFIFPSASWIHEKPVVPLHHVCSRMAKNPAFWAAVTSCFKASPKHAYLVSLTSSNLVSFHYTTQMLISNAVRPPGYHPSVDEAVYIDHLNRKCLSANSFHCLGTTSK